MIVIGEAELLRHKRSRAGSPRRVRPDRPSKGVSGQRDGLGRVGDLVERAQVHQTPVHAHVDRFGQRLDEAARQPPDLIGSGFNRAVYTTMFLRTMNPGERFSWIAWSWLISLASMIRAKQSRRRLRLLVRGEYERRSKRPLIEVAAALEAVS